MLRLSYLIPSVMSVASVVGASAAWADNDDDDEMPFTVGKLFFQLNDTDGDLGIHAKIDGEAWKKLVIEDLNERRILAIKVRGRLRQQGITELAFESAEPGFDELSPEEFFARFPEGEYEIEGTTLEGNELENTVQITHVLPAPIDNIVISGQAGPQVCDEDPIPSVIGPVVISWDPVTQSHPDIGTSGSVDIESYEIAIERLDTAALVMTVNLPGSVTELEIPSAFIALGEEFKFQILARDAGGNETGTESCFTTAVN